MNVLGRLALRALGAPAEVRPRLGGLFENPAADGGIEDVAAPAVAAQLEQPAASSLAASIVKAAAFPIEPTEPPPAPVLLRPRGFVPPPPAGPADRRSPEAQPRPDAWADPPSPPSAATPAPTSRVADEPGEGSALAAARRPPQSRDVPAAPPEPYRPLLPALPVRRADASSLAQRGEPGGERPADIHVSIGRIEVRGETERRAPAPAPRPEPRLMSLEDYLAKGRRR